MQCTPSSKEHSSQLRVMHSMKLSAISEGGKQLFHDINSRKENSKSSISGCREE